MSNMNVAKHNKKKFGRYIDEPFFAGPIALNWLTAAANCRGRSLHLAMAIAHQVKITGEDSVKLTSGLINKFGLSRHSAYLAIECLSSESLIEIVERKKGKAVVVKAIGMKLEGRK